LDETKLSGGGGIAKNLGMDRRINAVQTARNHRPAALMTAVAISPSRESGAEESQGRDDCERDEEFPSTHCNLLISCRRCCPKFSSVSNV
jgi:hypothetical protein